MKNKKLKYEDYDNLYTSNPYRDLAASVILLALRDAQGQNYARKIEAYRFLKSHEDLNYWLDYFSDDLEGEELRILFEKKVLAIYNQEADFKINILHKKIYRRKTKNELRYRKQFS